MEGFYLDPHVHTSEVSGCGKVPAAEVVRLYRGAGCDAIVITDHYYDGYFQRQGDIPWKEKVECYRRGYCAAREEGERSGLRVLFG